MQRHARREQKVVCGLRQVRSLRMLIPASTTSTLARATSKYVWNSTSTPLRLTARPSLLAEQVTDHRQLSLSSLIRDRLSLTEMLLVVALARVMQAMSWSVLKQQARLKRANIEYVLLAGSALFLCKRGCTFVC